VIVAVALLVIGIGRSLAVTSSVVLVSAVVAALPFGCSVRLRGNCARCRGDFSSKWRAWSRRIYFVAVGDFSSSLDDYRTNSFKEVLIDHRRTPHRRVASVGRIGRERRSAPCGIECL